jgi:hypothetical protein
MDLSLIKTSLGLSDDASDAEVLAKIQELRAAVGDSEYVKENPDLQLLKAGQHPQCCTNADGSVTVTLLSPIPFGKDTIPELTLRRPKMKDLKLAQDKITNHLSYVAQMICSLSGQAPKLIDELDVEDTSTLSAVVGFLQRPRQTGR